MPNRNFFLKSSGGGRSRAAVLGALLAVAGCGGKGGIHTGVAGATGAAGATATAGTMGAAGATGAAASAGAGAGASLDAAAPTDGAQVALGDDAACSPQPLERLAPDLLLLLDRSGSMAQQLDDRTCPDAGADASCVTKWGEVTKAINQVVQETETTLHWGLKYFPEDMSCGVQSGVAVAPGAKRAAAIGASIAVTAPGGETPTRLAVASVDFYLQNLIDGSPKVVVLATDGLPNCAPDAGIKGADDSAAATATIKALADFGIPVYVVGIGTVVSGATTLENMAVAGGRPRATEPAYYPVDSSLGLVDALHAIGAQTGLCAYALPSVPTSPGEVVISAGGLVIPHDVTHAEGWDYDATMTSVRLFGSWCANDKMAALTGVLETQRCH